MRFVRNTSTLSCLTSLHRLGHCRRDILMDLAKRDAQLRMDVFLGSLSPIRMSLVEAIHDPLLSIAPPPDPANVQHPFGDYGAQVHSCFCSFRAYNARGRRRWMLLLKLNPPCRELWPSLSIYTRYRLRCACTTNQRHRKSSSMTYVYVCSEVDCGASGQRTRFRGMSLSR